MLAKDLAKKLKNKKSPPCVVDVRSGMEFRSGHIPGAIHVPFLTLLLNLKKLPSEKETPIVIYCELGPRAELARTQMLMAGYRNLELLKGHMSAWRRANLPQEKGSA